jgi:dipeptidyl aminopeptidase/acylaminoacyl peptidase
MWAASRCRPTEPRSSSRWRCFPGTTPADTKKRLDEDGAKKASGKIYDNLFFRHWDTWSSGTRSHLFAVKVAGGDPVDVMKAMDADAPSKPFGGNEEYAFTPDGKGVVFTARDVGKEEAWSTNFDLYLAPLDGSAAPKKLTSNPAWDTSPVFSPDGKTLAYLAHERPGYESDRFRIVLRSWPNGTDKVLTQEWDRSPSMLAWSSDGKEIYGVADHLGHCALFAIDAATGKVRTIQGTGHVQAPQAAGARVLFSMDTLQGPAELYVSDASGKGMTAVTSLNKDRLATVRLGAPEQMTFKGAGGDTVYAWIVKPVDFDPAKKYPVAFLIHGGPQGSFGNDFHYRWNPQTYAGRGYAAVMVDFHGSTGYGQAFTDAINNDWGGKPFEDLKKGLDAALAKYPWMDGQNVAALGASYGGWMINWIAGNWPGPLQVPRRARRQPRRAVRLLRDRGAVVPGVGARRDALGQPAGVREAQPGGFRLQVEDAHARRPRREGLPRRRDGGVRHIHGAPAEGDTVEVPVLPRRESLGVETPEQHPLARHGPRLDRPLDEVRGTLKKPRPGPSPTRNVRLWESVLATRGRPRRSPSS